MNKLIKSSALSVAGIMLSIGAVTASAHTNSIDTTGPDSENVIRHDSSVDTELNNETTVEAGIDIQQDATTGDARATGSTEAGDAETGSADNANTIAAAVSVDNSSSTEAAAEAGSGQGGSSAQASIERTGPDSTNRVISESSVDMEINNTTDLMIDVSVDQDAESGDATVNNNTMGGNAMTGNASNSSATTLSFSVHN